jgi:2'-5' RNA ligase
VRLFVALVPPADARAELATAVDAVLPGAPVVLRWTPREQWHLTLAFLGNVSAELLPAVHGACAVAVHGRCAGPLRIAGAGRFTDRVLWAGLDGDLALLVDLARRLAAALRAAGIDVDDRPYRPHLTLARAPRHISPDLRPTVAALDGFVGRDWQPDAIRLMHSRLGAAPGGHAVHAEVGRWPLRAAAGS